MKHHYIKKTSHFCEVVGMSGSISNQTFLKASQDMYFKIHEGIENKLLKDLFKKVKI